MDSSFGIFSISVSGSVVVWCGRWQDLRWTVQVVPLLARFTPLPTPASLLISPNLTVDYVALSNRFKIKLVSEITHALWFPISGYLNVPLSKVSVSIEYFALSGRPLSTHLSLSDTTHGRISNFYFLDGRVVQHHKHIK